MKPKKTDESKSAVNEEVAQIQTGGFLSYINSCDKLNIISVLIVVVSISVISYIGVDECKKCFINQNRLKAQTKLNLKKYSVYGRNSQDGHLRHVFAVLDRIGFEQTDVSGDWDLLWAHDYPFRVHYDILKNLKFHQKVNHFPGCGYLTNKVDLATSGLRYIPPAFKLPAQKDSLLKFSSENPEKKFVIKNNDHRNVRVKDLSEIDLNANDSFVQEFIDNPLLVSGYWFDIGIYTIITSVDPLRIYMYNGDALLRFCPEKYRPFDRNNLDKYVVGDDYLPTWEVPGLQYYYNELGFGMRDSLNAYLLAEGKDPSVIWSQIEDAIRIAVLAKEPLINDVVKRFKSKDNFFEMMRIDFVVDQNLKVSLMEANMSPNLSSAHFKPNQLLYEQVIFNLFGLIGIGQRLHKSTLASRSQEEELMQSAEKNIAVMGGECKSDKCKECLSEECKLCKPCMSADIHEQLLLAHKEHLNRGDCKRIFPPPMVPGEDLPEDYDDYSANNKIITRWFYEKCAMDSTWCN
ncbi:PREDICTED: tubulin polyglutamylase TTLL6 [Nicrophorus vespilloides]|uniref:Tubulin polyglutamylase TTLL6 n=1 Tax=Nicrophorus vespilloides TaxID=110193 RepID=A0ABM1MPN7_NICVS|nr:PREDICTED: tubulin polyglutamylase TTLL6 [Nicrophorus vespilloides]